MQGQDAGRVYYERLAKPDLDKYTNSPAPARQQWFRNHFTRMVVFSPYFDGKTSWYPSALVYFNLYGIQRQSALAHEHPDWILHDTRGNLLYVPWGCSEGACPQYAADIANPGFRAWWIDQARSTLSRGYRGLWIDDANMEFRVSDGTGKQVAPLDSSISQPMSPELWRNHVAEFLEQIHKALPKAEIVHNSIWFAGPQGVRDGDPAIQRQIKAADHVNVERGIASDTGLTGGMGEWSVYALLSFIDRVHSKSRGVTLGEYELDGPKREYALAGYFLVSSGADRLGDANSNPDNWPAAYSVDLGTPLGARSYRDGVFERKFSCGIVYLGEPGLRPKTINLESPLTTLDGRKVRSVELSGKQGIVLRSCPSAP